MSVALVLAAVGLVAFMLLLAGILGPLKSTFIVMLLGLANATHESYRLLSGDSHPIGFVSSMIWAVWLIIEFLRMKRDLASRPKAAP